MNYAQAYVKYLISCPHRSVCLSVRMKLEVQKVCAEKL